MTSRPTDDQIVDTVGYSLFDMALGDLHRSVGCNFPAERITRETSLLNGQAIVGLVIQACALIEAAGHHVVGRENPNSGNAFNSFVSEYMTDYNPTDLYQVLRCGLLHEYMPKHHPKPNQPLNPTTYLLVKNADDFHLQRVEGENHQYYFNIQSFIEDVDLGLCEFLQRADRDGSTERSNLLSWALERGVMSVQNIQIHGGGVLLLGELASGVLPPSSLTSTLTSTLTTTTPESQLSATQPSFGFRDRTRTRSGLRRA